MTPYPNNYVVFSCVLDIIETNSKSLPEVNVMLIKYSAYKLIWQFMKRIMPESVWSGLRRIKNYRFREKKRFLGEKNDSITFYVIRLKKDPIGLFSVFSQVIGNLIVAERNGYVPVIDMSNYASTFYPSSHTTVAGNAWERFFKQPTNYRLEDVKGSRNVVYSKMVGVETYTHWDVLEDNLDLYREVINKWIVLTDDIRARIDTLVEKLDINEKTLGVFCRGTDYVSLKPKNHPIQPDISELIKEVHDYVREWDIEKIYFVTEDRNLYDTLEMSSSIVVHGNIKNKIQSYKEGTLLAFNENSDSEDTDSPLEYLSDVMILSKCGHFLGSLANGSMAAILLNHNKFINKKILFYGVY